MRTQTHIFITTRPQVIKALTRIRQEWQEAADGKSLIEVETPVGLLLADFASALGLTRQEQEAVLGQALYDELLPVILDPGDNGN